MADEELTLLSRAQKSPTEEIAELFPEREAPSEAEVDQLFEGASRWRREREQTEPRRRIGLTGRFKSLIHG